MNILLTNAGRRTYFIDFLSEIKKREKLVIHVADSDKNSAAFYTNVKKKVHLTPKVIRNEKNYLSSILNLVKKSKISLIIPLSDLDLEILSKNKIRFEKNKCSVAVSNYSIIKICNDKKKLFYFCKKNDIGYPEIYSKKNLIKRYPIVIKEKNGSGSKNLKIYKDKKFNLKKDKKFIIQKFIKGTEYNVDIFNDNTGNFLSCCIKKKYLMRSGETDKCEIVKNKNLEKFAMKISKTFKHIGNLDCDIIVSRNNELFLVDVNPRFGGGYPFTHISGLNYLEALIKNYKNKKMFIKKNPKYLIGMKGLEIKSRIKR